MALLTGINAWKKPKNVSRTTAPGVTDDKTQGFEVGSHWTDTVADDTYVCQDATTGAAVWTQVDGGGGGSSDHGTLTGLGDDDHTQYQLRSEKDAANGYAGLDASSLLDGTQQVYGTGANTACEGNDSRLSDDRTADGIRTASTIVSVSAATAPSAGQVLKATSSTVATWQNEAGGVTDHGALTGLGDDDHTQYQLRSEKDSANGYAGLSATTKLDGAQQTYGTGANTACEGNDSRLSDDRTADGLRTASTIVAIAAATAPSSGQVLTATSSTAADWQTPAAGGETNTASNLGAGGVGVFDGKVGVDLQFRNINVGSTALTVTDDSVNEEIDLDLNLDNANTFTKSQRVGLVTLTDAASIATDAAEGNDFRVVITANRAFAAPTNLVSGGRYTWIIVEDGTGGHTPTFDAIWRFLDGSPIFNTNPNKINIVSSIYDGTELVSNFIAES